MVDGPDTAENRSSMIPVYDSNGLGFTFASFVPVATQHGTEHHFEIVGGDHVPHEIDEATVARYQAEFNERLANASDEERTRILGLLQQIQSEELISAGNF